MEVYTRKKQGIVVQIRKGKESKAFTLQSNKSLTEIREMIMTCLVRLDNNKRVSSES